MSIKHKTMNYKGNDFRIAYIDGVTHMCVPDTAKLLGLSGTAAFRYRIPKESIRTILPEKNYRNQRKDYIPFEIWLSVIRSSYRKGNVRELELWLIENHEHFPEIKAFAGSHLFHVS